MKIKIGQIYHDKECKWTDGWKEAKAIHIVLSGDRENKVDEKLKKIPNEYELVWRTVQFYWSDGAGGYIGAGTGQPRLFTEKELEKLYLVGSISDVISF